MNFLDELRNLDVNDPGRWPTLFHALAIGLFFVLLSIAGYYFLVHKEQAPRLERAEAEERELKRSFEQKQRKAANFDAYSAQLAEIERSFGTMLRQLPGRTEIPNLLVDISQTGLAAGLQEELFQPLDEVRREFYAEKPIRMRLSGSYHQLGQFVSDIAALPRIVTLHDIEIGPRGRDSAFDELTLVVTAKTYRYLDDDEIQEATPAQPPRGRRQRAPARTSSAGNEANPG